MPDRLQRYLPYRRYFEVVFWLVYFYGNATANLVTVLIDERRWGPNAAPWEVAVWELSSNTSALLLLPVILKFEARWPLHWGSWRRNLPRHLLFSVAFSLAHVALMVLARKAVYALTNNTYVFGNWLIEWPYEYLKDARGYGSILALIYLYRLVLLRLQGEASVLTAPDEGLPAEPLERPQRLLVRKLGKEFLIAVDKIEWMEASGNYVNLHVGGHTYPLRSTMNAIEARLDPTHFRRVHRRFTVNLAALEKVIPLDSGDAQLILRGGQRIPCSRRHRDALRS